MAKIKILHILSGLCFGGIENTVISICNDLNKELFDVNILVLSNNDNQLKKRLNVDVKCVELNSTLTKSGFKEVVRLFCRKKEIERIIKEIAPDVVHTHIYFYTALPIFMAINHVASSARHFHTIHTTGLHYDASKPQRVKIWCEQKWYRKNNTSVTCVSKETQRRVKALMPTLATHFIPNYVAFAEQQQIAPRASFAQEDQIKIAYVARLVEGKNHRRLLEALSCVVKNYPNAQLCLIGDGVLLGELENRANILKIKNNVNFCGFASNVQELLQRCDICIFPSEYEGFSVALIEMMSAGLPVACSDIDNFRDLSIETDDMLYFDPLSVDDIAEKLQLVIENDLLRERLYASSRRISSLYTKQTVIPQYEQLYGAVK